MNKNFLGNFFMGKKKIFGKFNLFDILMVFLVILCVIAAFAKITNPRIKSRLFYKEDKTQDVLITIVLNKGADWIFDSIVVGDFQKGDWDEHLYEIVGKEFRPVGEAGKCIFVNLRVKAVVRPGGVLLVRGGGALKIGQLFTFNNESIMFMGRVAKIEIPWPSQR